MTTIENIRDKLEQIERGLFEHSIHPMSSTELLRLRQDALDLKENFLNSSFMSANTIEELEDIRFRVLEVEVGAHIFASEAMYQSTEEPMRRLNDLYQTTAI
ncbi:hypothetical protein C7445_1331 [Alicyclobacillus sacchari]|uniref:Uncharacterized protein n=1 Tax=Alicyclobacillus sacchari TaxID=392010 RepID=A0A4R8L9Y1_9BACL|nr:hypothetical protein [Alicyclobacillus sacchari]TDY38760.1 hypothetical protein C7445_1331 [Alicyclobacillus sacchari]GMA58044.1 hypothetical protein GCM10025858_25470 [Alicyclobacillus sacchari]